MKNRPFPIFKPQNDTPCCGPPPPPPAATYERAGYSVNSFVEKFIKTPAGRVPRVTTRLDFFDLLGTVRVRLGFFRESYRIAPGLYCIGNPDKKSPVLVSANYKLSFDTLRKDLSGLDVWLLILDTRGINVWCASAHKTFGTDELLRQIRLSGLADIVNHRQLILPQLGASGVNGRVVKKNSGFKVVWGPIRSADIKRFLANNCQVEKNMRKLTFTIAERLVLSPVEIMLAFKPAMICLAVMLVVSGIGPDIFSITAVWQRWPTAAVSLLAGLFAGAVLVPALLPWLPFREFYLKGILAGLPAAGLVLYLLSGGANLETAGLGLLCLSVSSFAAMNYTGATPFASPSGVEKEMRHAIPVQIIMLTAAASLWIAHQFFIRQ